MKPETIALCLMELKRVKQQLQGKPVSLRPNIPVEHMLIVIDEAAEDMKRELKAYPQGR